MVNPVYKGEALLMRWGESSANGRTVTFKIEEDGDNPFKGLATGKNGTRVALVAVVIDDHEEMQDADHAKANWAAAKRAHEGKPRKPFRDMPRSQQAALRCRDDQFQEWIIGAHGGDLDFTADNAATMVRSICGVRSRSELDRGGPASEIWDRLLTSFEYRHMETV